MSLETEQVYKLSSLTHHCLYLLPTLILSCQVDIWNTISCLSELFSWFLSQFAVCISLRSTRVKRSVVRYRLFLFCSSEWGENERKKILFAIILLFLLRECLGKEIFLLLRQKTNLSPALLGNSATELFL